MKKYGTYTLLILTGILASVSVHAQVTTIFSDNFNSYTSSSDTAFTTAYSTSVSSGGAGVGFAVGASSGLGSSQNLGMNAVTGSDATLVLKSNPVSLTTSGNDSTVTLSVYFNQNNGGQNAAPQVGFTSTSTGSFVGGIDIGGRFNSSTNTLQMRSNGGTGVASSTLTLTSGNWYELTYTLQKTATANTFNTTVSLFNSDSSGVVGSLVSSLSATVVNANIYASSSLFAGIRTAIGGSASTNAAPVMDNFVLTQGLAIPEPATYGALLGLGVLGFAMNRRRARAIV